jgi:hypothetical protein
LDCALTTETFNKIIIKSISCFIFSRPSDL